MAENWDTLRKYDLTVYLGDASHGATGADDAADAQRVAAGKLWRWDYTKGRTAGYGTSGLRACVLSSSGPGATLGARLNVCAAKWGATTVCLQR